MNRRCVHGLEYRNVSAKNITIFVNEFRFLSNKSRVCAIERTAANTKQNPVAKIVCLRGANSFSQQYHNSSMVPTDVIKYPNICIISLRYNNIRFFLEIQYAVLPLKPSLLQFEKTAPFISEKCCHLAEKVGFLFCGKATAVAMCHRHIAKSRLSNPTFRENKKTVLSDGPLIWRRRWDSNPRGVLPPTRFRVELVMTTSILLRSAPVSQVLNYYIILSAD